MNLLYKSTRSNDLKVTASQAILKGLSDDGGLFMPEKIPALDMPVKDMVNMTYQEVAYQVMKQFLTDFTEEEQTSFIERCENKEFNSIQEATKEIAYIAFMNKENTNQNNTVEFSAKVDFSSVKKNTVKKENVSKNCFDKLQDYVKEK